MELKILENIDFPKNGVLEQLLHLACQQGAKEIYLMGFDLSSYPLNNVYEELQTSEVEPFS